MANRIGQDRCATCGMDLIDWSEMWNPFHDTVQKAPLCTTCVTKIEEQLNKKLYQETGKLKTRRE